jgi:Leucine-rich repeat (LRR) protein
MDQLVHFFNVFICQIRVTTPLILIFLLLGLSQLSRLDLSRSGLTSLPPGELCGLTGLTHLNLSANRLQDLAQLGLHPAQACQLTIGSLDLSGRLYYTVNLSANLCLDCSMLHCLTS